MSQNVARIGCDPVAGTQRRATSFRAAWLAALTVVVLLWWGSLLRLHAQGPVDERWSRPIDLAAYREGKSFNPTILSDAAGGVHVFWDEVIETRYDMRIWVDYAYWDGENWFGPIDVFVGTEVWETAWNAHAAVDSSGVLHTVWIDGARLRYAQRHVSSPVSARSWIGKVTLAMSGGRIGPVDIALDDLGILHVLYLDAGQNPGIYYLRSQDGGENWEVPVLISEPENVWSQALQRDVFDLLPVEDTVHVAWIPTDSGKVYYAQGLARGSEWSSPRQMLQVAYGTWPNLVRWDDGILLLVTGTLPGDSHICYKLQNTSLDGGATWSVRHILMPHVRGCLGMINVETAYDGSHHLITSAYRSADLTFGGIYYSVWDGKDWSIPQHLAWPGVSNASLGTQIDFPDATISEGNILHVVFHVDEGRIWYVRRSLPASPAPVLSYPAQTLVVSSNVDRATTPTANVTGEVGAMAIDALSETSPPTPAQATATHSSQQVSGLDRQLPSTGNAMSPILVSVVASAVLVSVTLAWSSVRRRIR